MVYCDISTFNIQHSVYNLLLTFQNNIRLKST